jgi:hypothetical protein
MESMLVLGQCILSNTELDGITFLKEVSLVCEACYTVCEGLLLRII